MCRKGVFMYSVRTWYASMLFVASVVSHTTYSRRPVVYVGDTDLTTYVSIDQTTYNVIEDIPVIARDIATMLVISPYYISSPMFGRFQRIKKLWFTFAHRWREFIYTYIAEQALNFDDLYMIYDDIADIGANVYSAQSSGVYMFEFHTQECIATLERIIDLMDRPWFGWSSNTLFKMANSFENILEISYAYV